MQDPRIEAAAKALYVALFPKERTPEGWADVSGAWKKNYRDHATAAVAAIDSAATITKREQLAALPDNSVIVDKHGDPGIILCGQVWYAETSPMDLERAVRYLPAIVKHRGQA